MPRRLSTDGTTLGSRRRIAPYFQMAAMEDDRFLNAVPDSHDSGGSTNLPTEETLSAMRLRIFAGFGLTDEDVRLLWAAFERNDSRAEYAAAYFVSFYNELRIAYDNLALKAFEVLERALSHQESLGPYLAQEVVWALCNLRLPLMSNSADVANFIKRLAIERRLHPSI